MSQEIVCVIAGQRSGTNALRNAMTDTGRFSNLGEIFNTATMDWPGNFFGFCRDRKIGFADILSGSDVEKLCGDLVGELRVKAGTQHVLIDVKFNSWGEIRAPWSFLHQEPYFLYHLKNNAAKFIFIWRKDLVGQVVSDRIAARTSKWHNVKAGDIGDKLVLDVEECRALAALMCQSESYFWEKLKDYPACLPLCYEEMFEGRALALSLRGRLSSFMEEKYKFRDTGFFHRNEIDKSRIVANYAAIADVIGEVAANLRRDFLADIGTPRPG